VAEQYARRTYKKYCQFCRRKVTHIDYKDLGTLQRYISERGKIKPRRTSGNCTQHQSMLAVAIKRSREMALIPYTVQKSREGRDRDRGRGRDRD
jgi:small subunit ribosomal protein S18